MNSCNARCASSCRRTTTGSPASLPAEPPCITIRCNSGNAIAAPHSGAAGPIHARNRSRSGAIAISTLRRGRGSPGNVSSCRALASRDRASRASRWNATTVNREPSSRMPSTPGSISSCAPSGVTSSMDAAANNASAKISARARVPLPSRSVPAFLRSASPMD